MPAFDDALAKLPDSLRVRVEQCMVVWASHPEGTQVVANIRSEVALRPEHFESLLVRFAETLGQAPAPPPDTAWRHACEPYELHGAEIPVGQRPNVLGRGMRVGAFAAGISTKTGLFSPGQAERLIRRRAGHVPPPDDERVLRAGTLGGRVIWATFDDSEGNSDPFARLPSRMAPVRTALGLGFHTDRELLVLKYRSEVPAPGQKLCRPTVADANTYFYYRPHADATSNCGYTQPLDPSSDDLERMPEVVHAQVDGAGLIFPYQILV